MNKKGVTILEVIMSVAIISVVTIFLFLILRSTVKENNSLKKKNEILIIQSLAIYQLEDMLNTIGTVSTVKFSNNSFELLEDTLDDDESVIKTSILKIILTKDRYTFVSNSKNFSEELPNGYEFDDNNSYVKIFDLENGEKYFVFKTTIVDSAGNKYEIFADKLAITTVIKDQSDATIGENFLFNFSF